MRPAGRMLCSPALWKLRQDWHSQNLKFVFFRVVPQGCYDRKCIKTSTKGHLPCPSHNIRSRGTTFINNPICRCQMFVYSQLIKLMSSTPENWHGTWVQQLVQGAGLATSIENTRCFRRGRFSSSGTDEAKPPAKMVSSLLSQGYSIIVEPHCKTTLNMERNP